MMLNFPNGRPRKLNRARNKLSPFDWVIFDVVNGLLLKATKTTFLGHVLKILAKTSLLVQFYRYSSTFSFLFGYLNFFVEFGFKFFGLATLEGFGG